MKLILNEPNKINLNSKFILYEGISRKILTEATTAEMFNSYKEIFSENGIEELIQFLTNIELNVNKNIEQKNLSAAYKEYTEAAEDLENTVEGIIDINNNDVKKSILNYANATYKIAQAVTTRQDKGIAGIGNISDWLVVTKPVDKIKDIAKKLNNNEILSEKDFTDFKKTVEGLTKTFENHFKKHLKFSPEAAQIVAICKNLTTQKDTFKEVYLKEDQFKTLESKNMELSTNYFEVIKKLGKSIYMLKTEMTKQGDNSLINKLSKRDNEVEKNVLQLVETLQNSLTTVKELLQTVIKTLKGEQSETTNTNKPVDWTTRYRSAKGKDNQQKVWEIYLNTVWGKEWGAQSQEVWEKIKKIEQEFQAECEALGFSSQNNPFINYIKEVYLKYNLSVNTYNIIHNLWAKNKLTIAELKGRTELKAYSILFCKDLYTKTPDQITFYIQKEQLLRAAAKKAKKNVLETTYNLLYNLSNRVTAAELSGGSSQDLKLKDIEDLERLEEQEFGNISTVTADDDQSASETQNNSVIEKIATTEEAVKILSTLVLKFPDNSKVAAGVKIAEVSNLIDKSGKDLLTLISEVNKTYNLTSVTEATAEVLATTIINSNKFKFTTSQ